MGPWAALALLFASGCGNDGAALLVDLRTDYAAGIEFVAVRTEIVDRAGEVSASRERAALATTDFRTGTRVAELDGLGAGDVSVRVRLLDGRGATIAEKSVVASVRGRVSITVVIGRGCTGGTCPTCTTDADCVPAATCARGVCSERMCLFFAREAACDAPLYCDPSMGCVVPPGADAGVSPDSGPTDAGPMARDAGSACAPGCAAGEVCDEPSASCIPCGGNGQACCSAAVCDPSAVCLAGVCNACGSDGEPCCDDRLCDAARICDAAGLCRDCGGAGQPCCAGATCDSASLACDSMSTCRPCGGALERCCAGDRCDAPHICAAGICAS